MEADVQQLFPNEVMLGIRRSVGRAAAKAPIQLLIRGDFHGGWEAAKHLSRLKVYRIVFVSPNMMFIYTSTNRNLSGEVEPSFIARGTNDNWTVEWLGSFR